MSITKRASKFIKKQTDKIFNQEDSTNEDIIVGEVDLIEDDSNKKDIKSTTSLAKLSDINAKEVIDKKFNDIKSNKRDKVINSRLDEIERKIYGIENDIEDDEKCIVKNEEAIELISHRTEACETRIRVVEDRVQKLENDSKIIKEKTSLMDQQLKEESYGFLYLNIKNTLTEKLNSRDNSTMKKCLLSLSSFIVSFMFIWINTETTLLIGALLIIFPTVLAVVSLLKNSSIWFSFIKMKRRSDSYEKTLLEFLKLDVDLYISLKEKKNQYDKCNELEDFSEFIKMEKTSIKKNLLNVIFTLIVVIILFIFITLYFYNNTAYTFLEFIGFPFSIISKLILI